MKNMLSILFSTLIFMLATNCAVEVGNPRPPEENQETRNNNIDAIAANNLSNLLDLVCSNGQIDLKNPPQGFFQCRLEGPDQKKIDLSGFEVEFTIPEFESQQQEVRFTSTLEPKESQWHVRFDVVAKSSESAQYAVSMTGVALTIISQDKRVQVGTERSETARSPAPPPAPAGTPEPNPAGPHAPGEIPKEQGIPPLSATNPINLILVKVDGLVDLKLVRTNDTIDLGTTGPVSLRADLFQQEVSCVRFVGVEGTNFSHRERALPYTVNGDFGTYYRPWDVENGTVKIEVQVFGTGIGCASTCSAATGCQEYSYRLNIIGGSPTLNKDSWRDWFRNRQGD